MVECRLLKVVNLSWQQSSNHGKSFEITNEIDLLSTVTKNVRNNNRLLWSTSFSTRIWGRKYWFKVCKTLLLRVNNASINSICDWFEPVFKLLKNLTNFNTQFSRRKKRKYRFLKSLGTFAFLGITQFQQIGDTSTY